MGIDTDMTRAVELDKVETKACVQTPAYLDTIKRLSILESHSKLGRAVI